MHAKRLHRALIAVVVVLAALVPQFVPPSLAQDSSAQKNSWKGFLDDRKKLYRDPGSRVRRLFQTA